MNSEWLIAGVLLLIAGLPVLARLRRFAAWTWIVAGICILVLGGSAWAWTQRASRAAGSQRLLLKSTPSQERPGGYVSSDNCQSCHPGEFASWHRTFHRTMTQLARPEAVKADFTPATLELLGEKYSIEQKDSEYWAEMPDPEQPASSVIRSRVRKRLCMLTGSHHMQVFWVPSSVGNTQTIFPFCYLLDDKKWVPFHSTFLRDPKISPFRQVWNSSCINCHSTGGQPRPDPIIRAAATRVGELGISCEACHGPAEAHVRANQNPLRRYKVRSSHQSDPTIVNPAKLSPKAGSQVCGQCHSIKWIPDRADWLENGFQYRPGNDLDQSTPMVRPSTLQTQPWLAPALKENPHFIEDRYWKDGIVRVSGREYSGMIESRCYQQGELSCLSCHSMHQSAPTNQLAAGGETSEACLQCHKQYRTAITQHTHHPAGSSGSECYNCHMPYSTYGLLKGIRNHYIESPQVRKTLQTGRPNACNLCHLDKSLGWTAKQLTRWYGHEPAKLTDDQENVSDAVLNALRGDAGLRALTAWSMGWQPALETSGTGWETPFLGQLLADPYSAVRYIAAHSLRRQPGFQEFTYDFTGHEAERNATVEAVLAQWRNSPGATHTGTNILLTADGKLEAERFALFLRQRDDTSMDLQE